MEPEMKLNFEKDVLMKLLTSHLHHERKRVENIF